MRSRPHQLRRCPQQRKPAASLIAFVSIVVVGSMLSHACAAPTTTTSSQPHRNRGDRSQLADESQRTTSVDELVLDLEHLLDDSSSSNTGTTNKAHQSDAADGGQQSIVTTALPSTVSTASNAAATEVPPAAPQTTADGDGSALERELKQISKSNAMVVGSKTDSTADRTLDDELRDLIDAEVLPKIPAKPKFYAGAARHVFGQTNVEIPPSTPAPTPKPSTTTTMSTTASDQDDGSDDDDDANSSEEKATEDGEQPIEPNNSITNPAKSDDNRDSSVPPVANKKPLPPVAAGSLLKGTTKDKRHHQPAHANIKNPEMLLMRHSGGQVSSLDIAQYVFWTGDEEGVARAVEEFIQNGLMTRENAIKLLREITMGIEYLQNSYENRVASGGGVGGVDRNQVDFVARSTRRSIEPSTVTTATPRTSTTAAPSSTTTTTSSAAPTDDHQHRADDDEDDGDDIGADVQQRILHNNANAVDASKLGNGGRGQMDISDKVNLADSLYTAYTLEETIYQLAKVMFYHTLSNGSQQGTLALQRLTAFMELESTYGRVSPMLQKRILDVLLSALSDCLAEHPDLIPAARDGLGATIDMLPKAHSLHSGGGRPQAV